MKKIIFLSGLPGSGKSTWAKEYQRTFGNTARVNKDELRAMLNDSVWSKSNEKTVLSVQKEIVADLLFRGYDVILDNTHLDKKHEEFYRDFCAKTGYEFETRFIDTPVEECIERDLKRENPVGKKVIMGMYNRYLRKGPKLLPRNSELEDCIICDIDGTIAKCGDRNIYDGSKVHLDTVIEPTAMIVRQYLGTTNVIFMSGRDVEHMGVTEKWLCDNGLVGGNLIMRKNGDKRSDDIVKKELYEEHIKGKYNVLFVIDDRKKVKRMWVSEGLFVFDVNQLDEEY